MTALCACGCWTIARVCRRSQHTGKNTMRPFMMWPSTPRSPSSPAQGPTHSPRFLFDFLTGKCIFKHMKTELKVKRVLYAIWSFLKGLFTQNENYVSELLTLMSFQTIRPSFIFGTQIKIFLKSESFLTLHRPQCN